MVIRSVESFLHIYTFLHFGEKSFRKTLWKVVKLLKMSNFTFFHNVFYAICILKRFNSHISGFVCSFFEFGTVSNGVLGNGFSPRLSGNASNKFCTKNLNQSTDSTEGQEIEDMRQHKRSDKVNLNIRPSTVTLTLGISN